jgi:hypothetical protein
MLGPQEFDIPQIRCRILPYTVAGNSDVLRAFTELYRENITQEQFDGIDAFTHTVSTIEGVEGADSLRFFVMFYQQNQSEIKGIHTVEGVSALSLLTFNRQYKKVCRESPVNDCEFMKTALYTEDSDGAVDHENRFAASTRQLLSGVWFYRLFFENRNRKGNGESTPDPGSWRELFESLFVHQEVDYNTVIQETMQELYVADNTEEYSYGTYHLPALLSTHYFLETCDKTGCLTSDGSDDSTYPSMNGLNETYTSYGDAVESIINNNPGLANNPGQETAFLLGVLASRLSAWQDRRGNSRTFIDSNELVNLDPAEGERWVTRIWDKALTYNRQENNGGVPWQGVYNAFHEANTAYKQSKNSIGKDEYRYYYVEGVNIGSALTVDRDTDSRNTENRTTTEA